jgi:hypothetical protein
MKIAVIGAGIFGITTAIKLARQHDVSIFERNSDILKGASDVNQCRIHRGYHYPRSPKTTLQVLNSEVEFLEEFSDAVINGTENYYCISKSDSYITSDDYINFCKKHNLEFSKINLDIVDTNSVDLCVKVKEKLFDYEKLKKNCWQKLNASGVKVLLNTKADKEVFEKFDFVVIATYADINSLLNNYKEKQHNYQFEICEKIFLELPQEFHNKSIVIMDGPFLSIDPVGTKNYFIIGDVVNTVHSRNVGKFPKIDEKFLPLLDKGLIKNPPFTKLDLFLDSGSRFFPKFNEAKYVGSSFSIKTVLPEANSTDDRPTLVERIDENIITIFSGKISTCMDAANQVEKLIKSKK